MESSKPYLSGVNSAYEFLVIILF